MTYLTPPSPKKKHSGLSQETSDAIDSIVGFGVALCMIIFMFFLCFGISFGLLVHHPLVGVLSIPFTLVLFLTSIRAAFKSDN